MRLSAGLSDCENGTAMWSDRNDRGQAHLRQPGAELLEDGEQDAVARRR